MNKLQKLIYKLKMKKQHKDRLKEFKEKKKNDKLDKDTV